MRGRILLVILSLISAVCVPKKTGIIIAGSTSVQPFIEKLADVFMEKHPGITISVQGGGSSAGVIAAKNGTCNIGTSSRYLKSSEQGLQVTIICLDGIAIVVHKSNPVVDLSMERVRAIFSGRISNWKEVGGPDVTIIPVTREEGSGTRGAFEELIMKESAISDACLVQDSNGAVREIIATTPQGIGYISAGLVDDRIKALTVGGIGPSYENFVSSAYSMVRPFILLTKSEPAGDIKTFIDYILSGEGQQILKHAGLIPVRNTRVDSHDQR